MSADHQIDEYRRALTLEADRLYTHIQNMCRWATKQGRFGQLWDDCIADDTRRYESLMSRIRGLGGPIR